MTNNTTWWLFLCVCIASRACSESLVAAAAAADIRMRLNAFQSQCGTATCQWYTDAFEPALQDVLDFAVVLDSYTVSSSTFTPVQGGLFDADVFTASSNNTEQLRARVYVPRAAFAVLDADIADALQLWQPTHASVDALGYAKHSRRLVDAYVATSVDASKSEAAANAIVDASINSNRTFVDASVDVQVAASVNAVQAEVAAANVTASARVTSVWLRGASAVSAFLDSRAIREALASTTAIVVEGAFSMMRQYQALTRADSAFAGMRVFWLTARVDVADTLVDTEASAGAVSDWWRDHDSLLRVAPARATAMSAAVADVRDLRLRNVTNHSVLVVNCLADSASAALAPFFSDTPCVPSAMLSSTNRVVGCFAAPSTVPDTAEFASAAAWLTAPLDTDCAMWRGLSDSQAMEWLNAAHQNRRLDTTTTTDTISDARDDDSGDSVIEVAAAWENERAPLMMVMVLTVSMVCAAVCLCGSRVRHAADAEAGALSFEHSMRAAEAYYTTVCAANAADVEDAGIVPKSRHIRLDAQPVFSGATQLNSSRLNQPKQQPRPGVSAAIGNGGVKTLTQVFSVARRVKLSFRDLSILGSASHDTTSLTVLDNVSGVVSPGQCNLIMGVEGRGKSALLRVLAGAYAVSTHETVSDTGCGRLHWTGDVLFNDQSVHGHARSDWLPLVGFLPQAPQLAAESASSDDGCIAWFDASPTTVVWQWLVCEMRMRGDTTWLRDQDLWNRVKDTLSLVGLMPCATLSLRGKRASLVSVCLFFAASVCLSAPVCLCLPVC